MKGGYSVMRVVSPEATDLLDRVREHYRAQNKMSAAANYVRHLRAFFAWAEAQGYTIHTLPADSVEVFLRSTGQTEVTTHVMRTQMKSALRAVHNDLGVDLAHLQYEPGKPRQLHRAQKEREKVKRKEKRIEKAAATLNLPFIPAPNLPMAVAQAPTIDHEPPETFFEEPEMASNAAPAENGNFSGTPPMMQPVATNVNGQPQIVVVPMQTGPANGQQKPAQNQPQKPLATIGGGAPQRGVQINNHTFSGAHIRVSRVADGSDPFVPMGTETYVTTLMASQIAPHGDVAAYMQQFIIPKLKLSPNTSQVPFVFHELNDRKQPTGRRDELVVGVPLSMMSEGATPVAPAFHGMPGTPPTPVLDPMTQFMFRKLDEESAAAKERAEKLDAELRQSKDAQTQAFLMQQMQRENDLRRELEERKMMEMSRAAQAASMPPPAPVFMPPPEPPKPDMSVELIKAQTESQSRLLEAILVKAMAPPPPPPPQKDVSEWLVPFIAQMNQQAIAQQQANQALLLQQTQQSQQFMQALLTRENPMEKYLLTELREVKAQANAPKGDDLEDFADKFQKFKMLSEMMPGGGGGEKGGGLLEALVSNFDTIGAGIAKVLGGRGAPAPTLSAGPEVPVQVQQPQLAAANPQAQPAPQDPQQIDLRPTLALLEEAGRLADDETKSREVVEKIIQMVNTYATMPEPAASMGRRIVTAFGQVEDEDDLFSLTKHFWVAMGQKPDKPVARAIAKALFAWFPVLHKNIFGEPRFLAGQSAQTYTPPAGPPPTGDVQVAEEEEGDEEEMDDEEGEEIDDEGAVGDSDEAVMATVGA